MYNCDQIYEKIITVAVEQKYSVPILVIQDRSYNCDLKKDIIISCGTKVKSNQNNFIQKTQLYIINNGS
jgi:hypothetical protein